MEIKDIVGPRLKFFRQRARMSQLELEVAIGTTPGAISRIESGKVNPTKETILQLANILKINNVELDYLIGVTSVPATDREIEVARQEVRDFFQKKVFAYLIDERWRFLLLSEHFRKILDLPLDLVQDTYKKVTTIQFLSEPRFQVIKQLSQSKIQEMYDFSLRYYYKEVGFMDDDEYFKDAVRSLRNYEVSNNIWSNINYENNKKYTFQEGRKMYFKLFNRFDISFTYYYEQLLNSSRFRVVVFVPDSKFVDLVSKII